MKPGRAGPAGPLIVGEAINRAGRFLLLLLLAREVGAESFAAWVIAIATGTILANSADGGLITTVVTEIGADRSRTRKYLRNLWAAAPVLMSLAFVVLLAISPLLTIGTSLFLLLALGLAGTIENSAVLLLTPLRAHERFAPEGVMRAGQGIVFIVIGSTLVVTTGGDAAFIAPLFLIVALASLIFAGASVVRSFGLVRPGLDLPFLLRQLRISIPAFGTAITFFLYFRIDAYMLAWLKGDEATGLYGAAYNFAFGAAFLPLLFGRAMLARFAARTTAGLRQAYAHAIKVTGALAVGLSVLLVTAMPAFVFIYGNEFSAAQPVYLLLVMAQALYFFSHLNQLVLFGQERRVTGWLFILLALGVNIAGNLVLIPPLGASGAALAMIASELVILAVQIPILRALLSDSSSQVRAARQTPEVEAA